MNSQTGEAPATPGRQPGLDPRRWWALALLCVAFGMVILGETIAFVAIPAIESDLGFSPGAVQWVVSAYALTVAGLLLFCGRVSDLLGRRRMFVVGMVLFVGASLACGLAASVPMLLGARVVQGIGAAIVTPAALSLLMAVFPEGPERNKALGIWAGIGGFGATAALLVGGPITSWIGWEWIFWINVPVGLLCIAITPLLLSESHVDVSHRSFDLPGALTSTVGLLAVIYAVFAAPEAGWLSAQTIGLLLLSVVLLSLFVVIEKRTAQPLLPLRILRSRQLLGGNLVFVFLGMALDGMLFILTLYVQDVLDYSALQYGLMMAVMTGASIVGSMIGQGIVTKAGAFGMVAAFGMLLVSVACVLLTFVSPDGGFVSDILPAMLVFGPGLGAAFVAASIASLAGIPEEDSGLASGLENTSFQLGGALGVAIMASVAVSRTNASGGDGDPAALVNGFQAAFVVAVVFGVLGVIAALLTGRRRGGVPVEGDDAPESQSPARTPDMVAGD